MSYLSELLHRQINAGQALGKSVAYIKQRIGLVPTDAQVDGIVTQAEEAAALAAKAAAAVFAGYIRTHAPMLPAEVIAATAATMGLQLIDAAIAGAANVIKDSN